MQHIRNSVKGVFLLEHNTVPTALITDFGEKIKNGSLCIDRGNDDLYILKNKKWVLVNSKFTITDNIIETTYNDLVNLQGTNGLVSGQLYKIEYQTIHQIPNTNSINIGSTENLILTAISGSNFTNEVISVEYPNDIILYDINDNLVEDGITSRPGFIKYRKDTINNNESFYDFRVVQNRLWKISTSSNKNWSSGTNFIEDELIINSDSLWKCILSHTSGTSFDSNNFIPVLDNISTNYYLWNSTSSFILGEEIFSDSSFQDFLTFNTNNCFNVTIDKKPDNKSFNNIIIDTTFNTLNISKNIFIGRDSYNLLIKGSHLNIKSGNNSIIGEEVGYLNINNGFENSVITNDSRNINIKEFNSKILINECDNVKLENSNTNISFLGSTNLYLNDLNNKIKILNECDNIRLKNKNSNFYLNTSCKNIEIENETENIFIFKQNNENIKISNIVKNININGDLNKYIFIGKESNNINLGSNNESLSIGNKCDNITLNDFHNNIEIKNNCSSISIPSGNDFIFINNDCNNITFGSVCLGNKFGEKCSNIILNDNSIWNEFGDFSENITLNNGCSSNIFGKFNSNLILDANSINNFFTDSFKNKTFSNTITNSKILISDNTTQTYSNTFNNIVSNMIDSNNDIWYQTIDVLGSITTQKMQ